MERYWDNRLILDNWGVGIMRVNRQHTLLFLVLMVLLPACVPVVVGGGILATGSIVGESRTMDSHLEDSWVAMKIRSYYVRSPLVQVGNIGVSAYNGKVLLTGSAASQEEIDEATRIARGTRGVIHVRSEIRVQYVSAAELATDALLTHKVKLELLADNGVHGLDIHVKTTKKVVYLTGAVRTVQERDRAIEVARRVPGVREVVSYIDVGINQGIDPLRTPRQSGTQ